MLIYRPVDVAGPLPVCLHLHGGGYVLGLPEMNAPEHRRLAATLPCMVVSVDYRLAPETRAPGALEDADAGLGWLHGNADALGIDSQRIGVMGESAGGGLAAAFALYVRDRREFQLVFQRLSCPMLDDRSCTRADPHPLTGDYVWTPQMNRFGWRALLGCEPGSDEVPA